MTHLDPNPPTGQRPGPGAGRPQTMWLIAAAIIVLLVLGYFASGDRTSVTPQTPGATAPADTDATAPAPPSAPAPVPAPAPASETAPGTAPQTAPQTGTPPATTP